MKTQINVVQLKLLQKPPLSKAFMEKGQRICVCKSQGVGIIQTLWLNPDLIILTENVMSALEQKVAVAKS